MPVAMVTNGCCGEEEDYMKMGPQEDPSPSHSLRNGRHASRRRTFRRRVMRRQSHSNDLVILHSNTNAVFEWARYIKTEVETRCRANTQATLINSKGFIPDVQDNVRRTVSSSNVVLVIISPDLVTSLETIGSYSFDFLPVSNMAGAVLFFCGVEESRFDLRKYFPSYDCWTKFTAQTEEEKVIPIFEHLAKIIGESSDSSPEQVRRATVHRGPSDAAARRTDSFRNPQYNYQRRRGTLKEAIQIFPDRGQSDQMTDVVVILSDDLLPCNRLDVEYVGEYTLITRRLETTRLNKCTFQFTMPESTRCEVARLRFIRDDKLIGSSSFFYESALEEAEPVVEMLVSALEGLCELHRETDSNSHSSRIDQKLTQTFQRQDIPVKAFEQLFASFLTTTKPENRSCKYPTLLHVVAKYGLQEVMAMLLDLPGAKHALSITDCDGNLPNDIARINGHQDLNCFLEDYLGMVENEELIYDSLKAYSTLKKDGIEPLSEEELNCNIPIATGAPTVNTAVRPPSDYSTYMCASEVSEMRGKMNDDPQDIYMAMGPAPIQSHMGIHPGPPPTDIKLDTEVPGPGVQFDGLDYIRMVPSSPSPRPMTPRRPLPPPPRDFQDLTTEEEVIKEEQSGDDEKDSGTEKTEQVEDPQAADFISAPVVPFENLLAPNEKAPKQRPSPSTSQAELLDIIYQVKQGEISVQDAECLVDGWKRQHQIARWDKKSFMEKKESIRVLKDSYLKTAEKVKEDLPQPKPGFFKKRGIFNFRKKTPASKGSKTPPPTKAMSEPIPASEPMIDPSRLQLLQRSFEAEQDPDGDPVCQSIPELPPELPPGLLSDESKRFSTISTSSSSSATSCMSRTSYGSQQDSGIDVPIREESPALQGSTSNIYDRPAGPPRPVLPVPAPRANASSDECSGYEDVDSWTECDGGSVRARTDSNTTLEGIGEITPPADKHQDSDEAPPIPPRSRRSSSSSITDTVPLKSPNRSRLLPPKAMKKSSLPQPRGKYPPIGPKPSRSASESSGSEDQHTTSPTERRTTAIPTVSVASVLQGGSSLPSPRAGRPPTTPRLNNYTNVVLDLKTRQRKASEASSLGMRTPRGSTSDEGSDPPPSEFAPPVPPRPHRDLRE